MRQALLLIAGFPGTGKTYLANQVMKRFPTFDMISLDPMKERAYDKFGFDGAQAKSELDAQVLCDFLDLVDARLATHESIISDYPFSEKQRPRLLRACEFSGARPLTIRMTCNPDLLFERQRQRDLDPSRHLGHVVFKYHSGDVLLNRRDADDLLTRAEFDHRLHTRGYDTFSLGETLEVDSTDFAAIHYDAINDWIETRLSDSVRTDNLPSATPRSVKEQSGSTR